MTELEEEALRLQRLKMEAQVIEQLNVKLDRDNDPDDQREEPEAEVQCRDYILKYYEGFEYWEVSKPLWCFETP